MPKASPQITTFDAGELSPLMGARVDVSKFANGCITLENFLCVVQGPLIRRGGTRYVAPIKDASKQSWLLPFIVSDDIAYMCEFGDGYIRFFANRGQLVDGTTPVEIASPYALADLTTADGTFAINAAQSADTMYLFHGSYPIHKLLRTASTTFEIDAVSLRAGPFAAVNSDESITIQASAQSGTIALTASGGDVFTAADVGQLFYLEHRDNSSAPPWATYKTVAVGDVWRVDSRTYLCTETGTYSTSSLPIVTGTETPTHTEGSRADGDMKDESNDNYGSIGAMWQYQHSGYCYVRITAIADARSATCELANVDPSDPIVVPQQIVDSGTFKWAHALFNVTDGYPQNGTFWRDRLCVMRDRWLAASTSSDFENFATKQADEQTDDSAIVEQLNARQLNKLAWMIESDSLLVGMTGDEWVIGPANTAAAVSATNINAERRTSYGSKRIQPVQVGGLILFVQKRGRKLRDFQYDFSTDNYVSTDTTKLADHITRGKSGTNNGIMSMCYQQEPRSIVWAARADGQLIAITYDREEGRSDVYGWHRHPMNNAFVECVASIPSPDGDADDVWMIVRREINGQTVRYVEYLNPPLEDDEDQSAAFYVDAGLTYTGTATEGVSGLSHLEGQTVSVLTDGAVHPDCTVSGGKIALEWTADVVQVGLSTRARVQTMQLNAGAADGTAQGKTKRITNIVTRFLRSLGGKVGPDFTNMEQLNFRKPSNAMDQAVPLYTGDMESNWPGGYEMQSYICYENDQPLPVSLLGFFPIVVTNDDR
ncbi:hypothetical protein [Paraburkholderia unamae]|uniref:Tail protein n=1 Tax=Paraburkholderia unamae TaxID=219649 RepID=A0ABX5KRZ8_9BURK|nr:hypothetical protein [Paraburkholderia unamae]PVX84350.1 hypothetical protein C7402_105191 [Paraburkholderia unamae]